MIVIIALMKLCATGSVSENAPCVAYCDSACNTSTLAACTDIFKKNIKCFKKFNLNVNNCFFLIYTLLSQYIVINQNS